MSAGVLATVHTYYPSFTNVEREIADYILSYGKEVVYMPITELAYRCSVCETSIVRFCRRLGLAGYQAFRLELSSALEAQRQQLPACGCESDDPVDRMLDGVYQKHLAALNSTRHMLTGDGVKNIVERLALARQVYFFGLNRSISTAFSACQTMMAILHKGCCAMEPYTQKLQASLLTSFDVAFFFSHHGDDDELLSMAYTIKPTGAFSIAITCCGESPLNKLCDASLCCGCNADPARPSELDFITGKSSKAYIVEALCTASLALEQTGTLDPPENLATSS